MALVNRERDAEEAHTTINLLKRIFSKSYNFAYHMKLKFQKKNRVFCFVQLGSFMHRTTSDKLYLFLQRRLTPQSVAISAEVVLAVILM